MFNIPLRVRNLKNKYGDILFILKVLNIEVVYGKTPDHVNGFWRRILRRKYICLSEKLQNAEFWQQEAVIAHELGHILLHPQYKSFCMAGRTYFPNSHKEDEADQFAAEFISHLYDINKAYVLDFLKSSWK